MPPKTKKTKKSTTGIKRKEKSRTHVAEEKSLNCVDDAEKPTVEERRRTARPSAQTKGNQPAVRAAASMYSLFPSPQITLTSPEAAGKTQNLSAIKSFVQPSKTSQHPHKPVVGINPSQFHLPTTSTATTATTTATTTTTTTTTMATAQEQTNQFKPSHEQIYPFSCSPRKATPKINENPIGASRDQQQSIDQIAKGKKRLAADEQKTTRSPNRKSKELFSNHFENQDNEPSDRKISMIVQIVLNRIIELGVDGLIKEFKSISNDVPLEKATSFNENPTKNRYHNIPCCEATRVRINLKPTFYIHGNYISSQMSKNRFIATQGPLHSTIEEFWRMIIAHHCEFIVMLCDLVEKGKPKCAEYFPQNIGDVSTISTLCNVTKESQTDIDTNVIMSVLKIVRFEDGLIMNIRHIHWKFWPDFGVPETFFTPFKIFAVIRQSQSPIVVHCAAGVGRTGTFIMISLLMENVKSPEFRGILPVLVKLREERWKSVQTDMQYLYIHRCFLENFLFKKPSLVQPALVAKFREDYQQLVIKCQLN